MEISSYATQKKRLRKHGPLKTGGPDDSIYTCDLQLYKEPPDGQIPLTEFQELGLERLKVLQTVDSVSVQDNKTLEDFKNNLESALRKEHSDYAKLLQSPGNFCSIEARRRDHISHFILRLAYCQTEDLKNWFIAKEVEFFKLRFTSLAPGSIKQILATNDFDFSQVSDEEKDELRGKLYSTKEIDYSTDFYKLPFENVTDLVKDRKVFIKNGSAYVPHHDLISVILVIYKEHLTKMMEIAKEYLENMSSDDRLINFLKSLPQSFSGMTKAVWSTETTPIAMLDDLSKISYPLCMRTLHEALRRDHHLKHGARQQYGLFLKGIGVSLDDAMVFWKQEFLQKIDEDTFHKRYRYNIRHNYGKEGKQTNYTPYGCTKIITEMVGAGEFHGCPYKQMSKDILKSKLISYGMRAENVNEIADLAAGGHYNLACQKYFEIAHKRPPGKPLLHPNAYFAESREILTKDTKNEPSDKEAEKLTQSVKVKAENVSVKDSPKPKEAVKDEFTAEDINEDELMEMLETYKS
ncbi:DNA primase large subunit-like [Belonocnema kinseyi]|uniref:DNA primase large subunit-like n=1 Tax=Belonocnema kinseyi TaxID=2817044 RepID=UPI00143D6400|nr:DNA primase large subunit-like [Belonocnema kinseyi]XP_033209568.1 DNA primase large subunit-like [Belonocnema kinseyi]